MERLTQRDDQGNWCLKGMKLERLRTGGTLTKDAAEKLYAALCKLKDYENTDLSPEEVDRVNDFSKSQASRLMKELQEEREKHQWIPVTEQLPEPETYALVSFSNFSLPIIGRYDENEEGGVWFAGDEDEPLVSQDMFVNAWMPLPEVYREK